MKRAAFVVLMVFAASGAFTQYQGFEWGTQRSQIEGAYDELEPLQQGFYYEDGHWTYGFFFLNDGRLARGATARTFELRENVDAWEALERTKQILIRKYGNFLSDGLEWFEATSDLDKAINEGNHDRAIRNRLGYWETTFETDTSAIVLQLLLEGEAREYVLFVNYDSLEFGDQFWEEYQEATGGRF